MSRRLYVFTGPAYPQAISSPRAPDREDWCALVEAEWDDISLEFAELVLFHIRHESGLKDLVLSRIRAGEKFGPLDLASLDFPVMVTEEIADSLAYLGGQRLHERTKSR